MIVGEIESAQPSRDVADQGDATKLDGRRESRGPETQQARVKPLVNFGQWEGGFKEGPLGIQDLSDSRDKSGLLFWREGKQSGSRWRKRVRELHTKKSIMPCGLSY